MEPIHRREVKYLVPRARLSPLRADLAALLVSDRHNRPLPGGGRGYWVRSVYFETWTLHAVREKEAGLFDRFKLRVRGYPPLEADDPHQLLILEIKQKRGDAIIKHRTRISVSDLELLFASRHGALLARHERDAVLRRFVAAKASLGSVVPLIVDYRREAFHHPSAAVYLRATLDSDLRVSTGAHDFFAPPPIGRPFGTAQAVLEIKTSGPPPDWLALLTDKHRLDPRAVSKFLHASERSYTLPG